MKFKEANNEQLEAIKHVNGPLLIIAGPGTGKTYTLINRALNLIVNHKVDPSSIMFVTFTEKASNELISRLSNVLYEHNIDFNPNDMLIGTFHSVCLKLIKDNLVYSSLKKNFELMDQFEQQYFIYRNFNSFKCIENFDLFINSGSFWDRCEQIVKIVNRLQEELINPEDLINSQNQAFKFYGNLIKVYQELLSRNNLLDFANIQREAYRMLTENEEILCELQNKIQYVMVDEYQDTNHIQEKLTFLIGGKHNNICVVGDDDQAIYRFRGATVRNILEFPNRFKDCKQVILKNNYRSNPDIVRFYNQWMDTTEGASFKFSWNNFRYDKTIKAVKSFDDSTPCVVQLSTKEENYIEQKTLEFINKLKDSNAISD